MVVVEFEKGPKEEFPEEYREVVFDFFNAVRDNSQKDWWWTTIEVDKKKIKKGFEKLVRKYCNDPEAVYIISVLRYLIEHHEDESIFVE